MAHVNRSRRKANEKRRLIAATKQAPLTTEEQHRRRDARIAGEKREAFGFLRGARVQAA